MRWRQPSGLVRSTSRMTARARLLISAILTSAGQAVVQKPHPEHQSTVRSGDASSRRSAWGAASTASRNRCAWGPTYLGPGKRSVTRRTGQTVLQTLHLRHSSAERPTGSAMVMPRPAGPARRLPRAGTPLPARRSPGRRRRRSVPPRSAVRPAGPPRSARRLAQTVAAASSVRMPARAIGWPPGASARRASQPASGGASTGRSSTVSRNPPAGGATRPPPVRPPVASTRAGARIVISRAAAGRITRATRPLSSSTRATASPRRMRPPSPSSRRRSTAWIRRPGMLGGTIGSSKTGPRRASRAAASTAA